MKKLRAPKTPAQNPFFEISPGTQNGWYDLETTGGSPLGTLVEMAGSNVSQGGYTWLANQAYFFWPAGGAFPGSFRMTLHAMNTLPTLNPATASPTTTTGPFNTSTKYTPATGGSWWTIQKSRSGGTTSVGYLNIQPNGVQNWYETNANTYLTVAAGEALIFTSTATAPTAKMYRAIATPV